MSSDKVKIGILRSNHQGSLGKGRGEVRVRESVARAPLWPVRQESGLGESGQGLGRRMDAILPGRLGW